MMSDQSNPTLTPDDVLVRPQPTPNPSALKFVVNQPLKREGKATINAPEETPDLKLVEGLFQIQGVKQLHFFQNTVTVTHEGTLSPEELVENVIPVLKTRIPVHNPDFGEPEPVSGPRQSRESLSAEVQQVEDKTKPLAVLWRKKSWAPQLLLRFLRLTNFCRGFIVTDLISVCWSVPAWSSGLRFIPDSSLIYVSSIKFTAGPDACRLSPWRFKTQHSFLKIQGCFISRSPPSILC
jgi:hypothetical protein